MHDRGHPSQLWSAEKVFLKRFDTEPQRVSRSYSKDRGKGVLETSLDRGEYMIIQGATKFLYG